MRYALPWAELIAFVRIRLVHLPETYPTSIAYQLSTSLVFEVRVVMVLYTLVSLPFVRCMTQMAATVQMGSELLGCELFGTLLSHRFPTPLVNFPVCSLM